MRVLGIGDETAVGDAAEAVGFLHRHGIASEAVWRSSSAGGVGADILAAADDFSAGLIVAGVHGARRLRDRVFGGVTTHLIASAAVPGLLSH